MGLYEQVHETVGAIRARAGALSPKVGIILGSGLGDFAEGFEDRVIIPYTELPHFPHSSVPGHAGRLVLGRVRGEPVVAMQGRVHAYEGHSPAQVAFPARVLCALGIRTLVVTNAAGGVNLDFRPGDLMVITDHLNLSGYNPLTGPNDDRLGPRFPDMTTAYPMVLQEQLLESGLRTGVELKRGIYALLAGPCYETPAEIRMLRVLGVDAVGMSTVPEVIAANHMGVRVAGVSCITNLAAGIGGKPLTHEEVAETAHRVKNLFTRLLEDFLPTVARAGASKA
ncbi:MAG TPA: purine-nucleoside phosphorylase [Archangium sp.]|jgi:purine-nucleoside phosphorylase|uniref:purine-nucleoside phosphorylase n=1 Tax=Archangium sp. TaxID=1872627 RepID=UPI002ED81280